MIDPKEFIRGEYLPHVCDMRIGTESNLSYEEQLRVPDKKHVSMYAKTENVCAAHDIIRNNPDKLFTLVTHNSDMPIRPCTMPDNMHKWFAMNRDTTQDKIHSIPIGLENEHWFPYKQSVMLEKKAKLADVIKCFAQFNTGTHPERLHALNNLDTNTYDLYIGSNGYRDQHILFCNNLLKYAFCLCPRGNGIDTHRLWEALYMGCIPICKDYPAHQFDEPLPILFVQDWNEITTELLEQTYKNIDRSLFNSNLLKMSYWSKRINNEL
jgi:hypothetical protein